MFSVVGAQLKILSWRGDGLASDVLPIVGLPRSGPDFTASLATYYPLSKERTLQVESNVELTQIIKHASA